MYDKAEFIIRRVSLEYGVPTSLLTKKGKWKHVVQAKAECRRRLRAETKLSWGEINQMLGYSRGYHRLYVPVNERG